MAAYSRLDEVKMTTNITDAELVASFQSGDVKSFEELVERYIEKVYNLAWRISRIPEDAEEILQDVFISVFTKIGDFRGNSAFSSWLYRITANTAFMKLRKRKKHSALSLDEAAVGGEECCCSNRSDACDVNYLSSRHELRAVLQNAVSKLPAEYRPFLFCGMWTDYPIKRRGDPGAFGSRDKIPPASQPFDPAQTTAPLPPGLDKRKAPRFRPPGF